MLRKLFALVFVAGLTACAAGNKIDYSGRYSAATPVKPGTTIALGVQDLRSAVVSGEKSPDYVGKQRDGWGIPFDVRTGSGRPLADEVNDLIQNSLSRGGGTITPVGLAPTMGREQVQSALAAPGTDRQVYVSVREWRSDSLMRTSIVYDITAQVFDRDGQPLAENRVQGDEAIDTAALYKGGQAIADVFQRAVDTMLRDEKIRAALQ
ncbi:hypothetical protein [Parvibaculum sp.]|jgi:hypothetical protein|uniref:hypothetical protein n=1 Tax=Parvibaculum sp. TaxID=2024848 RepID=UPI0034A0A940